MTIRSGVIAWGLALDYQEYYYRLIIVDEYIIIGTSMGSNGSFRYQIEAFIGISDRLATQRARDYAVRKTEWAEQNGYRMRDAPRVYGMYFNVSAMHWLVEVEKTGDRDQILGHFYDAIMKHGTPLEAEVA